MVAPNIEEISASLRNCSLGGRRETKTQHRQVAPPPERLRRRRPLEDDASDYAGITVDLNSEVPLPCYWEQCLDMRIFFACVAQISPLFMLKHSPKSSLSQTGEFYYVNRADGTRTTEDPRLASTSRRDCCSSSEQENSNDDDDEESEQDGESSADNDANYEDEDIYATSSCYFSVGGDDVLVAAGCKSCFIYIMVPRRVAACPNCGGGLLHLSRSGHF
ncbi:hypothetical protein HPP92_006446 [Vanilla planifolia]|uniref:Uncharacterized protein n=1 Tax=Vanilla planifolia TaxID=51239 RepID=A0A835RM34_VANPL|nr:hypothetical protein HPP92_006446 [Vanilla planifolia]